MERGYEPGYEVAVALQSTENQSAGSVNSLGLSPAFLSPCSISRDGSEMSLKGTYTTAVTESLHVAPGLELTNT